jgi:lipopolysaccharide/colanic/teichoic acid biosynthesis glycosyltransferase
MKRFFDILMSLFGLIILSPFIIITALAIKMEDKGPVFYRSQRVGLSGKLFTMYKFRTMVEKAELSGPSSTATDDIRITKTGKFLRRFKIDEIPQLINVFVGKMSIVGPRPEIKRFTDMFTDDEKAILNVKPGITDWASIWNSNEGELLKGCEDPDEYYIKNIRPEKLRLQLIYAGNHNFFIDLQIIFLTLRKIVFKH